MNRRLFRYAAIIQLVLVVVMSVGCTPTQPFFLNESPNLQYYLDTASAIEYPDVQIDSLAETTESLPPLTIDNHEFEYWDLTLEDCVNMALHNSKFFMTVGGTAEQRQNVAAQITSGQAAQFGSVYDPAIQQTTTQSVPLTVDSQGNRVLPRGAARANQVGGVEDALAEFDAQVSGFFNVGTTDRVRNVGPNNVFNPQQYQAFDSTQQAAISKRTATGGVVTLREQVIYARNNVRPNDVGRQVSSDYTAVLEAQWQHPLMRNRGTLINRLPVVLASLNEDTTTTDFEISVRNLVRDVEVAYWDLYVAYRNVETAMIGRNSAQATADYAKKNLAGGKGTTQDVAQAAGQYFQFRSQLESALTGSNVPGLDRFGVYGAERLLREKMGLAPTDSRLIRPIDEPSIARVEFDWTEAVCEMLTLSPELRNSKTEIKKSELELIGAKNRLLPEVNFSVLYRWVGVGDTLGPSNGSNVAAPFAGSSALGELTDGNYQEIAARLEYTPSAIGQRRPLADVRNKQLQLARNRDFLREKERLLVSQLSDAFGKQRTHYHLIETTAQQLAAAVREVDARLALYRGGLSPVNEVLQSQLRRAQAQVSYYQALAEYNKSLSYIHYLKGTLLYNCGIELEEGPWPKKAYWDAIERARERTAGKKIRYGVTRPNVVRRGPVQPMAQVPGSEEEVLLHGEPMILEEASGPITYSDEVILEDAQPMGSGIEILPPATSIMEVPSAAPGDASQDAAPAADETSLDEPLSQTQGEPYMVAPVVHRTAVPGNPMRR
ncbi:TolC family protein [Roseimaritima ulvae]|uniref:Outer membrane efflux protein n=1 Tax=Roseimaritima ulvae TaxID=980254 RepID=A0A5B9QZI2_9BACT|nr:TolC family protein [Roseimaritima ulvae]QEG43492.1 Outer membrane efflux protein [Roseimaritima ulvae]